MRIEDQFRVNLPVEEAWKLLLDIERIAPCMPGAALQEVEGDEYRGVVKVKVGPITAQYKGAARFAEVDEQTHRAVISANGRDTRGQGNASATVTASLEAVDGGTQVRIDTDLSITGKVAQFGRGVIGDVSSKLLAQFVDNLERDVLHGGSDTGDVIDLEAQERDAAAASEIPGPGLVAPPAHEVGASTNGARRIESIEPEPVDLLAVSGTPLLKRLAPVLAAVLALLLLRRARRRRRSRS
ncbi:MAG TPA: SRPBCC family protein [Acidimicrobiia bacterium]|nr:SRPBCC family protein [Acidimicrobiia bacterium]